MSQSDPRCVFTMKMLIRAALGVIPALVSLVLAPGCAEGPRGPIEPDYLLKLEDADQIGYQIAWQSSIARMRGGRALEIIPFDDYVIATESGMNVISALTARDGTPVWQVPIGDELERMLGFIRSGETILAATQSDLYLLDIATGREQSHQRYGAGNVAATKPTIFGPYALYTTTDGRIVYHHLGTGLMRQAYRYEDTIENRPVWLGSALAFVSRTGQIYLHDPATNTRYWSNRVLDKVVATPAASADALFIAGTDQSLWAFRASDGKRMWRYRTQQPLIDDPKLIEGTLYQAIPGKGLVALNPTNMDEKWICTEVAGGTVVARTRNGELIVWDRDETEWYAGSTFYRIDERTGDLLGQFYNKWIDVVAADSINNGNIYLMSPRGRVVKLVP